MTSLSCQYTRALEYMMEVHGNQIRKGGGTPYVAHLLAVSGTVLDHGGSEDAAIGGLLHDSVEDAGGMERLEDIRRIFGNQVARYVLENSDSMVDLLREQKRVWMERKEAFINRIGEMDGSSVLISMADKLHNVRSSLMLLPYDGEQHWEAFRVGKNTQLWYYTTVVAQFQTTAIVTHDWKARALWTILNDAVTALRAISS